jgi:UDP-glucose 4-epimerase
MAKKINVFITGVSGFIAQKIVERFSERDDIGAIIGIDIVEPPCYADRITFIKHDVRDDMAPVMSRFDIDWAIHTAFVVSVLHDRGLMEDIDINGTSNFLDACAKLKIKHVVQLSSTTAYGSHEDNPPILTEESRLRGNKDFCYGESKAKLELTSVKEFREKHPDVYFAVVRPCFVCGPHFYKNPLGRHLMKKVVILPSDAKPFQFVHEDDVADGIYFLLKNKQRGAFNLAGDGTMTFQEMIKMTRGIHVPIPPGLMYPLNNLSWYLRFTFITEFPSLAMVLVRHPWIADNSKIKKAGYKFKYSTLETYKTFAEQVRNYMKRGKDRAF